LVPRQRGIIESDLVKAIKIMPSRHKDKIESPDGSERETGGTNDELNKDSVRGRQVLPHARASERVHRVRLDRHSVLVDT